VYVTDSPRKKFSASNGSSRSFASRPVKAGQLPKVDFPASVIDVDPAPVGTSTARAASSVPRPATRLSGAVTRPAARSTDPLRVIGAATVGLAIVYGLLWSLGALMNTGGQAELERFNAGKPVMLCTEGGFRAVDDSLLGRVFGERYFTCRDWKMGF
jgi:hypothetical protein